MQSAETARTTSRPTSTPVGSEVIDLTTTAEGREERLVKSAARVRDLGEVFTPAATVDAMLDLIPESMWQPHPSATFLEPACGDGNFLVAILQRKLDRVAEFGSTGCLAAGESETAVLFHALEALSSIYAIDISVENVIGGTPGHEIGARTRLLDVFHIWHQRRMGIRLASRSVVTASARWIVDRNIQVGNMLPSDSDGQPSGRDELRLVEYSWDPEGLNVAVTSTTLGAVAQANGGVGSNGQGALDFGPSEPVIVWSGKFDDVRLAPIDAPGVRTGTARNGKRAEVTGRAEEGRKST